MPGRGPKHTTKGPALPLGGQPPPQAPGHQRAVTSEGHQPKKPNSCYKGAARQWYATTARRTSCLKEAPSSRAPSRRWSPTATTDALARDGGARAGRGSQPASCTSGAPTGTAATRTYAAPSATRRSTPRRTTAVCRGWRPSATTTSTPTPAGCAAAPSVAARSSMSRNVSEVAGSSLCFIRLSRFWSSNLPLSSIERSGFLWRCG